MCHNFENLSSHNLGKSRNCHKILYHKTTTYTNLRKIEKTNDSLIHTLQLIFCPKREKITNLSQSFELWVYDAVVIQCIRSVSFRKWATLNEFCEYWTRWKTTKKFEKCQSIKILNHRYEAISMKSIKFSTTETQI